MQESLYIAQKTYTPPRGNIPTAAVLLLMVPQMLLLLLLLPTTLRSKVALLDYYILLLETTLKTTSRNAHPVAETPNKATSTVHTSTKKTSELAETATRGQ